jgi:hypothetical protein
MAVDRKKLINLRNNIQAYLDRIEKDEKLPVIDELINNFTDQRVGALEQSLADKLESINFPDFDVTPIVSELRNLKLEVPDRTDEVVTAISNIRFPEVNFPNHISVDNFPPQKIPTPVTNININGLRGPVKSTAMTVTDTITELPATSLENRRSLIVWNNSPDTVLWIGDETVTVAIGIPVKPQNYSPALDLSDRVKLYGVCDTGESVDARILELSMIGVGA